MTTPQNRINPIYNGDIFADRMLSQWSKSGIMGFEYSKGWERKQKIILQM